MEQLKRRWITERDYAAICGLNPQTLRNWRHQDRQAGRREAAPGYPPYRRFGGAVRYLLDDLESQARPAA
jgi:hypothetical protein